MYTVWLHGNLLVIVVVVVVVVAAAAAVAGLPVDGQLARLLRERGRRPLVGAGVRVRCENERENDENSVKKRRRYVAAQYLCPLQKCNS